MLRHEIHVQLETCLPIELTRLEARDIKKDIFSSFLGHIDPTVCRTVDLKFEQLAIWGLLTNVSVILERKLNLLLRTVSSLWQWQFHIIISLLNNFLALLVKVLGGLNLRIINLCHFCAGLFG